MAQPDAITFTTTLSVADWDANLSGWRCSVLRIPGAEITSLYTSSGVVDRSDYEIIKDVQVVRWRHDQQPPANVILSITLTQELASEELTARWKKLAIVLPVIATIVVAVVVPFVVPLVSKQAVRLPPSRFTPWTIMGRVDLSGLNPLDVKGEVTPPRVEIEPDGAFSVTVPIETREDGLVGAPSLIFQPPPKDGYKVAVVHLNPGDQDRPGNEENYNPSKNRKLHTISLNKMVVLTNTAGPAYASNDAQVAHPQTLASVDPARN